MYIYKEQSAGGYQDDNRPVVIEGAGAGEYPGNEAPRVVDGNIIYAQGPVAGEQNMAGGSSRNDR